MISLFLINKKLLRRTCNNFLFSLTFADLLVASTGILIGTLNEVSETKFLLIISYFVVSLIASALNLLMVTTDRFIAIMNPFRYRQLLSKRKTIITIAITWSFVIMTAISVTAIVTKVKGDIELKADKVITVILAVMITVASLAIVLLFTANVFIFKQAHKQFKHLSSMIRKSESTSQEYHRILKEQETKTAHLCFIMVFLFSACWLPLVIYSVLALATKYNNEIFLDVSILLVLLNATVDPVLYVFIKKEIRTSFTRLFSQCTISNPELQTFQKHSFATNETTNASFDDTPELRPKRNIAQSQNSIRASEIKKTNLSKASG